MQKYERRKCQRFPIKLDLKASRLYKQDHVEISGIDADIRLVDISRTGIGFLCEQELPLNYYFDTKIDFMGKDYFYCVIKIVRITLRDTFFSATTPGNSLRIPRISRSTLITRPFPYKRRREYLFFSGSR